MFLKSSVNKQFQQSNKPEDHKKCIRVWIHFIGWFLRDTGILYVQTLQYIITCMSTEP